MKESSRRKFCWVMLFACVVAACQSVALACETTEVNINLLLDDRSVITSLPSDPTTFPDLAAAAAFSTPIQIIDALGITHTAILYLGRASSTSWMVRLYIGGDAVIGGAAGLPTLLGATSLQFDNDGSLVVGQMFLSNPSWSSGAPMGHIEFSIPGAVTASTASKVVSLGSNGSVYGCVRSGVYSDFDRDGTDDYVVFQRSSGAWIISKSSANGTETLSRQFGRKGDYPIVGDYTGDGRPDLVLWRPKSGSWVICRSDLNLDCNQAQTKFYGSSSDRAVRGDFDGDGILDLAVRSRRSGKLSFLSSSSNTTVTRQLGGKSDVPLGVAVSE